MRIVLILVAVMAFTACTSMLLGNPSSGDSAAADKQVAVPSGTDSAISGSIRQDFSADTDLAKYAIGIRTISGMVTLSGTVGSYPARDRAVQIAEGTKGVKRVDNRIIVNTYL